MNCWIQLHTFRVTCLHGLFGIINILIFHSYNVFAQRHFFKVVAGMNCLFECFDQLYERITQHGWKSLVITPPVTWRVKWLEDGRRYEGEWHNYKRYPHGQGRMEYVDGEIYDGDWEAGVKTGAGRL